MSGTGPHRDGQTQIRMKSKELVAFEKAKEALLKKYQAKRAELIALRQELEAVGITVAQSLDSVATKSTKAKAKSSKPRKSYPELNVAAAKKFIGEKGKTAGELVKHFGTKFSTKANQQLLKGQFTVKKDGTSRTWLNK
jgi:hypothetical protein